MLINLPVFEIVTIMFFYFFFRWFFRFGVIALLVKMISILKDKGKDSLKEFEEKLKGGKEE